MCKEIHPSLINLAGFSEFLRFKKLLVFLFIIRLMTKNCFFFSQHTYIKNQTRLSRSLVLHSPASNPLALLTFKVYSLHDFSQLLIGMLTKQPLIHTLSNIAVSVNFQLRHHPLKHLNKKSITSYFLGGEEEAGAMQVLTQRGR